MAGTGIEVRAVARNIRIWVDATATRLAAEAPAKGSTPGAPKRRPDAPR